MFVDNKLLQPQTMKPTPLLLTLLEIHLKKQAVQIVLLHHGCLHHLHHQILLPHSVTMSWKHRLHEAWHYKLNIMSSAGTSTSSTYMQHQEMVSCSIQETIALWRLNHSETWRGELNFVMSSDLDDISLKCDIENEKTREWYSWCHGNSVQGKSVHGSDVSFKHNRKNGMASCHLWGPMELWRYKPAAKTGYCALSIVDSLASSSFHLFLSVKLVSMEFCVQIIDL